jgi:Flp pilus assembly protein TadD
MRRWRSASAPQAAPRRPFPPLRSAARFALARVLIALKRFPEAIEEFHRLVADDHPDRPRFLFGLATAYVLSGDVTAGRRHANDALALARARGQADLAAAIERDLVKLPQ